MKNNTIILSGITLSVLSFACTSDQKEIKKAKQNPNFIFILADDLGIGDVGFEGQMDIPTPNIDKLASEGMRMTNFYSGSYVCAPSRCALLTGKHTGHSSIRGNKFFKGIGTTPLDPEDITIPEALVQNPDYVTAICGRWHLGGIKSDQKPLDNGFHYHFGKLSSIMRNKYGVLIDDLFDEDGHHISEDQYIKLGIEPMFEYGNYYNLEKEFLENRPVNMDEMVTQKSVEFINNNSENPFFLYVSYSLVHDPIELQEGMEMDGGDWPELEKGFASMVRKLDNMVGEIVKKIDDLGLAENTIIMFTSDNGPHMEGGHSADFFNSNSIYKGYKRDFYEGGIKMPAIVRWKGTIAPGSETDHLAAFWDILPTVCDMAGIEPPAGIDGISFLPLLQNKEQKQHEYLYWEGDQESQIKNASGPVRAIRKEDWKLIQFLDYNRFELYNLRNDPEEIRNVVTNHPDIEYELLQLMDAAHEPSEKFPFFEIELANNQ